MFNWIRDIFTPIRSKAAVPTHRNIGRARQRFDQIPTCVYAIGDVHGCFDLLLDLEKRIAVDCGDQKETSLIIMLGDYIDRGSKSSELIDHLLEPPPFNAQRICIAGNHEDAMLAFINNPVKNAAWLNFGGRETLMSYGLSADETKPSAFQRRSFSHSINSSIPDEHIEFLKNLPVMVQFPKHIFVHAGIRPHLPIHEQTDRDLMWIRDDFTGQPRKKGPIIVHGHTPGEQVLISGFRLNVDTGAYISGHLSSVKFVDGKFIKVIAT